MEFVADFETSSKRVYRQEKNKGIMRNKLDPLKSKAFVCAWCCGSDVDDLEIGRSVESFFGYCEVLLKKEKKITIFTHNLKYDGAFILYHALLNNYEVFDEVRDNRLYSFKIKFDGGSITFRDSLKIFNCSVDALGRLYGIKKLNGEWDYKKYREVDTPLTAQEIEYLKHDVIIVLTALKDYRARGFKQNTIAAIAYASRLEMTYPGFNKGIAKRFKDHERFRKSFPYDIKPLADNVHIALLNAYFGGWCWLNPHYAGRMLLDVHSFDENSMYPAQMHDAVLPVGEPRIYKSPSTFELCEIKKAYPCVIYHLKDLSIKLKSEWHLPFMMFPTDPRHSVRCQGKVISCENEDVWLSDIDLNLMLSEYNVKYVLDGVICFKGKKGHYQKFVDYWMQEKEEATIIKKECEKNGDTSSDEYLNACQRRDIAKKMQNSSYGKDGTKLYRDSKHTILSGLLLEELTELERTEIEYYIPSAIYICANARKMLYQVAKKAGKAFIYSDTDSVKSTKKGAEKIMDGEIDIHPTKLGAWDLEEIYHRSKFIRQKSYATENGGKWSYTVCGAPASIKKMMKIEEFKPGMLITLDQLHAAGLEGKLVPVSVRGGVILEECPFQISQVDEWEEYKGQNLPIEKFVEYMRRI